MGSSPYENLPTKCLVCLWMSFSGCKHPDKPAIPEDISGWDCPCFTASQEDIVDENNSSDQIS